MAKRDMDKVKNGARIVQGKNKDGSEFGYYVRPLGSIPYQNRLEALRKPHGRALQREGGRAIDRECIFQAMAEITMPKIFGYLDDNGSPVPDTLAERMNKLRGGPKDAPEDELDVDFYTDVQVSANDASTFAAAELMEPEEKEQAEKNSESSSPGT